MLKAGAKPGAKPGVKVDRLEKRRIKKAGGGGTTKTTENEFLRFQVLVLWEKRPQVLMHSSLYWATREGMLIMIDDETVTLL